MIRRKPDERGAVAAETALLIPIFVLIIALAAAYWRIWWAQSQLTSAAEAAARAYSLHIDWSSTETNFHLDLAATGLRCVDSSGNQTNALVNHHISSSGTSETQAVVTASCTVTLSDLLVPGLPGTWTITAESQHPIDFFREQK